MATLKSIKNKYLSASDGEAEEAPEASVDAETVEAEAQVSTGSSPSTGFNSWIYSISFTILIAFAIMIILYLISRASRNKNDN